MAAEIGAPSPSAIGIAENEAAHGPRTVGERKPVGQVHDNARIEASLGQTQHEASQIELVRPGQERIDRRTRSHQADGRRADAPRNQDAGHPAPGTEVLDNQGAWNLEDQVADEKDSGPEAVNLFGEVQLLDHRRMSERDVGPIQVVHDVHREDDRQQPQRDLASGTRGNGGSEVGRSHGCIGG